MPCTYSYEGGVITETPENPTPRNFRIVDLLERKRLNDIDIENANTLIADRQDQNSKIDALVSTATDHGYNPNDELGDPDPNSRFIRL